MINIEQVKRYCAEPIERIENYDKAVADQTQVWHCHHIWETMLGYSRQELIEMDEYYKIPACNLIFLTDIDHQRLHHKSEDSIGEKNSFYGKKHTEETRRKLSELKTGEKNPNFGKQNCTSSRPVLQFTKRGEFVKEYPSISEVERQQGFSISSISQCCRGIHKTSNGYIWKYK